MFERPKASPALGFAALRLIGAALVIIDHSFPLTGGSGIFPDSWQLAPGYIALIAMFAMSGYQISGSWARDPSWWRFAARRLLRILPPLVALLMITVLVIGPLFTSWSAADYWQDRQTWAYLVLTALVFPLQHLLPGVFADNPYPWSVNGSIWTLPMELLGYGLVLGIGLGLAIGLHRLVLIPLLIALMVMDRMNGAEIDHPGLAGSFASVPTGAAVTFLVPFMIGMMMHVFRDRIPLLPLPALLLFGSWLALSHTPVGPSLLPVMATYCVIFLAHRWPAGLRRARGWIYCSYGTYLWGFLVQQIIVSSGVANPWLLILLALPAAYLCGLLSWRLVEAPTQQLKVYLRKPAPNPVEQPVDQPVPLVAPGLVPQDQPA